MPQRIKSKFFRIFSSLRRSLRSKKNKLKNVNFSPWGKQCLYLKIAHFFRTLGHYASTGFYKNQIYYTCNVCNIYNNYSFCIVIFNAFFNVCNIYIMILFYDWNCLHWLEYISLICTTDNMHAACSRLICKQTVSRKNNNSNKLLLLFSWNKKIIIIYYFFVK